MIQSAIANESGTAYQVTLDSGKVFSVPNSTDNGDYKLLMEWVSEGNTIQPYVAPVIRITEIEPEEFFDRFTQQEQESIASATNSDVKAKIWYDRLLMQKSVDLESPKLDAGLNYLVNKGLLTSQRKGEVLVIKEN